jgi:hypothetical protein
VGCVGGEPRVAALRRSKGDGEEDDTSTKIDLAELHTAWMRMWGTLTPGARCASVRRGGMERQFDLVVVGTG